MTAGPRARARIYRDRDIGHWTVDLYWRDFIIDRRLRRNWDDARACAAWWVNA